MKHLLNMFNNFTVKQMKGIKIGKQHIIFEIKSVNIFNK